MALSARRARPVNGKETTMKLVRDDIGLNYEEAGSGDQTMFLIHGAFADRTTYSEQFDHFAADRRVIAVELRGHGDSDKPPGPYSIEGFAEDVAWMCSELGAGDAILIGHSLGGLVALEAAARQGIGSAVITLDSPSLIPGWTQRNPGRYADAMKSPDFRSVLRGFLAVAYLPFDDPEKAAEDLMKVDLVPEHAVRATWDSLFTWDPIPALEAMEKPFLYLDHGQPDVPMDVVRRYCPQVVYGQTVGAGHRALQVVPNQVNAMIERFVQHADELADFMRATAGGYKYG
jgi:pimeloyl-ACP methyl ester carboxylesterase